MKTDRRSQATRARCAVIERKATTAGVKVISTGAFRSARTRTSSEDAGGEPSGGTCDTRSQAPLIGGGANVVFTSRQLGHGSSDITLRVYSYLFDGAEQAQRTRDLLEATLCEVVRPRSAGATPGTLARSVPLN